MTKYALIVESEVDTIAFKPEDGFIEVPDNVFGGFIRNQDGSFSPPVAGIPTLDQKKKSLKEEIDSEAERQRLRFITGGAGQALIYAQKADEAKAFLATAEPNDADYPLLVAEVGVTAPTVAAVAEIVHDAYAQWKQIGAAIEAMRLGTKVAIDAAATIEEVEFAASGVVWP